MSDLCLLDMAYSIDMASVSVIIQPLALIGEAGKLVGSHWFIAANPSRFCRLNTFCDKIIKMHLERPYVVHQVSYKTIIKKPFHGALVELLVSGEKSVQYKCLH